MAEIKIYLNPGETREEVEELLIKAFQSHAAGAEHSSAFHDPAPRDAFNKIINLHEKMQDKMLKEILKVINEEF